MAKNVVVFVLSKMLIVVFADVRRARVSTATSPRHAQRESSTGQLTDRTHRQHRVSLHCLRWFFVACALNKRVSSA
jgi:hypothetical protein